MIPDSINTNNHLKLEPVDLNVRLTLAPETMIMLGLAVMGLVVYGIKRSK